MAPYIVKRLYYLKTYSVVKSFLARGYVENTSCIAKYKSLLEKQRKHKQQIMELYDATQ